MTASELRQMDIVDEVVEEPKGGAHRDVAQTARAVDAALWRHLQPLLGMTPEALRADRHDRFRRMGPLHRWVRCTAERGAGQGEVGQNMSDFAGPKRGRRGEGACVRPRCPADDLGLLGEASSRSGSSA